MKNETKNFPTGAEWRKLLSTPALKRVLDSARRIQTQKGVVGGVEDFVFICRFDELTHEMYQRLGGAVTSYALMMFFYEQGIPDKKWYESPSKDGASIGYFPDFQEHHFAVKGWFDFYSDTFYYKLFSAWDIMGHLINLRHALGLKKPDFSSAMGKLGERDANASDRWKIISESAIFLEARRIRNDIAHNSLPSTTGMRVSAAESIAQNGKKRVTFGFGLKQYIPSDDIVSNARKALELFEKSIAQFDRVDA